MGASEWIALGALLIAMAAFGLGELRASRARRAARERNIVDWTIKWLESDHFTIECRGPDEARNFFVQLVTDYVTIEAEAKSMRRDDKILIAVPHLREYWTEEILGDLSKPGEIVNVVAYGGRITWHTPAGTPVVLPISGIIQGWRNYRAWT